MKQILTLFIALFLGVVTALFIYNGIIHAAIISGIITIVIGLIHVFSLMAEANNQRRKVYKNAFKSQYISDKW